jgi:cytochrome c oxidase assembly protein subunit 11
MTSGDRQQAANTLAQRHRRVALWTAGIAIGMLGMAYAAVPLYQMFCQVTGFAGTTQRATAAPDKVLARTIQIRFDSNVTGGLGWEFKPVEPTVNVKIGENRLAFYTAANPSDKPVTGTASFNVAPEVAGRYFNKIECFCFTEQTLKPGEVVEMPVSFFIDPEIMNDADARHLSQITLSYTFYPVAEKRAEAQRAGMDKKGS